MNKYLVLALVITTKLLFSSTVRISSHPFLTGDTLRNACDFVFDDNTKSMNPKAVFEGSTVFVQTVFLKDFFSSVHPNIRFPYVLITHNSDESVPGIFVNHLDDPKILAWYGVNVEGCSHPKLIPLPIGFPNKILPYADVDTYLEMMEHIGEAKRRYFVYLNFTISTNVPERSYVYRLFCNRPYCHFASMKDQRGYLSDLLQSHFVLSPRGFGLDCHRTWESILMGAIPIVRSSSLDALLKDLPALIVKDWEEVTEDLLQDELAKIQSKSYSLAPLFIDYWLEEINRFKY